MSTPQGREDTPSLRVHLLSLAYDSSQTIISVSRPTHLYCHELLDEELSIVLLALELALQP